MRRWLARRAQDTQGTRAPASLDSGDDLLQHGRARDCAAMPADVPAQQPC